MSWIDKLLRREPIAETTLVLPTGTSLPRQGIVPTEWMESQPYLAFLQSFTSMRDAETSVPEYWQTLLGMPPKEVIQTLLERNILEEVTLLGKIQFCHSTVELKKLLAARGLKVSGKKAEQAQRLLGADTAGMLQLCGKRKIICCSPEAAAAVDVWLQERHKAMMEVADRVLAALRGRQLKEAIKIADTYKKARFELPVHPGVDAITIKTSPQLIETRVAEMAHVFTLRPKILKKLPTHIWEGLYLNHCLWKLIGTALPDKCMPGFMGLGEMDGATVNRMLSFYSGHVEDKRKWKDIQIKRATIMCCNSGSCDACLSLDGKLFPLSRLPELPYEHCTCALGCRCLYMPEIDFD